MCVEVDLNKPLVSKYRLHRRCGRYGHERTACVLNADEGAPEPSDVAFSNPLFQEEKERPELDEDFGPWMMAKKNVRRRRMTNSKSAVLSDKNREPTASKEGSRFKALEDTGDEEVEAPQPQQETVVPDSSHAGTTIQCVEGTGTKKTGRQLVFPSEATTDTPSGTNVEASMVDFEGPTGIGGGEQIPTGPRTTGEIKAGSDPSGKTEEPSNSAKESDLLKLHFGTASASQEPVIHGNKEKELKKANPSLGLHGKVFKTGKARESKRVDQAGPGGASH
ncbi:hypothetical protein LINPERHAP2_LOCUS32866 [Linum perenne]